MSARPDPAATSAAAGAGAADTSSSALAGHALALADWRRRVFELYRDVRAARDPAGAWRRWRAGRDELFAHHPQSPLPASERARFSGLAYFGYDPSARVLATVAPLEPATLDIATSGEEPYRFTRFGDAAFELDDEPLSLELYWLEGYGGGLYLPFADATSGAETYGAGRYLLDTVKGADLGLEGDRLVLDFNFAYNPSCAYDPRWVCPLAPPANRLPVAIRVGERAG
jgi:uncharacterized protein (DUF1684 family)